MRWLMPLVLLEAAICAAAYLASGLGGSTTDFAVITALVNLMLVLGLYVFTGLSGVFSFGHIAFMAIGGYVAGLLTIPPVSKEVLLSGLPSFVAHAQLGTIPATLIGGGVAMVVALVLSLPLSRLDGLAAGLGTFAILIIVHVVASNWQDVTGGDAGISPIPITTTVTSALIWVVVAVALIYVLQNLKLGLRLRASREDHVAAQASGIRVSLDRAIAFGISGFVLGVGGALFAQFQGTVSPSAFYLPITFLTIAMLVVGGTKSLAGAVVGTMLLSVVGEVLRRVESGVDIAGLHVSGRAGVREVGLAVVMVAVLIFRPQGVTGGREIPWPLRRRSASGAPTEGASAGTDGPPLGEGDDRESHAKQWG